MKTNVNLEFIGKVQELLKSMQELANFWHEIEKALEDANISEDYPFDESLQDLTYEVFNWFLTLTND